MIFNSNAGLFNPPPPQVDGSATAMAMAAHKQNRQGGLAKALPAAILGGLFLKGAGGMSGALSNLEQGNLKGVASGLSGSLLQGQAKGAINNSLANNLSSLGFDNFNDLPSAANVAIPAINSNMEAALKNAGHVVDLNGFAQRATDLLDQEINVSEPKRQRLIDIMTKLNSTPAAVKGFAGQPNAIDALKELRVLDNIKAKSYSAWQDSVRSGKPDSEQKAIYNILRELTKGTDGLESRVFSDQGAPLPFDDVTKQQMIDKLAPLQESLPDVYNNMSANIRGSTNLLEARHLMSDLVQGSKAHDNMQYKTASKGTDIKSLAQGPLGLPLMVYSGTGSPMAALSAGLMQSQGANVGLTSILRGLAK